ncbi:recombinase family protein [Chloroflexota bacterium]
MTNQPFPPGARLVSYLRDSGGVGQQDSVAQQRRVIGAWCDERGYVLVGEYSDMARSGTTTVGRDQFDELQQFFEGNPELSGVVFYDYSRWARNFNDGAYFLAKLRRAGYQVHSLEEQIPDGPAGRMLEAFYLSSAEEYSRKLGRMVKRAQVDRATRLHAWQGGPIPVGYRGVPEQIGTKRDGSPHIIRSLEPDPETAPLVRKAFEMRVAGYKYYEIHAEVNLYSYVPSYYQMFKNKIYIGIYNLGDLTVPDFCEPIVDRATWDRARELIEAAGSWHRHPRRVASSYLLSGLLRCKRCGSAMVGSTVTLKGDKKYRYYQCWRAHGQDIEYRCPVRRTRTEHLEPVVLDIIKERLQDKEWLAQTYQDSHQRARAVYEQEQAKQLRASRELDDVRLQIMRITKAIAEGGQLRSLVLRLAELEETEADLIVDASKLANPQPFEDTELSDTELKRAGYELWDAFARADEREKQLVLRSVVKEIRAHRVDGEIVVEVDMKDLF